MAARLANDAGDVSNSDINARGQRFVSHELASSKLLHVISSNGSAPVG